MDSFSWDEKQSKNTHSHHFYSMLWEKSYYSKARFKKYKDLKGRHKTDSIHRKLTAYTVNAPKIKTQLKSVKEFSKVTEIRSTKEINYISIS